MRVACDLIRNDMMIMYRAELSFDILVESEIGKTLNHLLHFCKIHEKDLA